MRLTNDLPPVETAPGHPAVAAFRRAAQEANGVPPEMGIVRFATDAAVFLPALGVPTLILGPGDPDLAHQPDEFIEIEKMVVAARAYLAAAVRMLG